MVEGTVRCHRCGAPLAEGQAPEGLCPACLLAAGLPGGGSAAGSASSARGSTAPERGDTVAVPPRSGPVRSDPPSPGPGAFTAPPPAEIAPHFPGLEVLELLGQGGMGMVYKARQVRLERLVALKLLPPGVAGDPAFAERFGREARALARLSHPAIVGVHDFGQAGPYYYLIMEYVDGANVRHMLAGGRLGSREALSIVPQLCDALQYAHDEGVVHRDIKPENILVDRRGRVKVADFGLAKLLGRAHDFTLTGPAHVMGTPLYMAPEQIARPLEVDHRADIYSLGVVLYELLTGELPLGRFPPPSERAPLDARLDQVVLRTLEREPGRRYQKASEVKTDLSRIAGGPGSAPPGEGTPAGSAAGGGMPSGRSAPFPGGPPGGGGSAGPAGERPPAPEPAGSSPRLRAAWGWLTLVIGALAALVSIWYGLNGSLFRQPHGPSEGQRPPAPTAGAAMSVLAGRLLDPAVPQERKQATWSEIVRARRVDEAIAFLEGRAAAEPRNADLSCQLGLGYIRKILLVESPEEKGMLGMKADKAFDRALAANPKHWEARFTKARALTFWPPIMGKDEEAAAEFEKLLAQQESGERRPEYVETYIALGDLHLKGGERDKALAVWRKGLDLFPGDKDLESRIAGDGSPEKAEGTDRKERP